VTASVQGATGLVPREYFLLDTGADRTVLSAALLYKLQLPAQSPSSGISLQGISGVSPFVEVATVLEFTSTDGTPARVRGTFAAFTDPTSTDLSILGRDVLDNFDLLVSRKKNQILLLAGNHRYHVTRV
jgi:hypothetical protein